MRIITTTSSVAARCLQTLPTAALSNGLHLLQHQFRSCASRTTREEERQAQHAPMPLAMSTSVAVYTIWGANTGVGKTLASVGLANATRLLQVPLQYLKPVQTGFPADSDARLVATAAGAQLQLGQHAQQLLHATAAVLQPAANDSWQHRSSCKVLHAWSAPVSPHLAVMNEGRPVSDTQLVSSILTELQQFAAQQRNSHAPGDRQASNADVPLALVETAGGVASPAPSGRIMCDTLLPVRTPAILVGDPRLGGISATISAYESLLLRGYDVDVILLMDPQDTPGTVPPVPQQIGMQSGEQAQPAQEPALSNARGLGNADALRQHFSAQQIHRLQAPPVLVVSVPGCQAISAAETAGSNAAEDPPLPGLAVLDANMRAWLQFPVPHRKIPCVHMQHSAPYFKDLVRLLQQRHQQRQHRLNVSVDLAMQHIWWPFTQHASLARSAVQVVESRCGACLVTHQSQQQQQQHGDAAPAATSLVPLFDACASWWTQAVAEPHHQSEVARSVAYAAGRYLHVMSPQVVHQVGLDASMALLGTVGKGWASRVFFSDDGSTAIEVALKMAFRKYMVHHELTHVKSIELKVIGLDNAYHGDTLGAMDCVAPSVFNAPSQAPWYRGRGVFLTPSYLGMREGRWCIVERPAWLAQAPQEAAWTNLDAVLSDDRDSSDLTATYRQYITSQLDSHDAAAALNPKPSHLAALIIEPLIQGAGGMKMVDPQFQRELVQVCRDRGIPVIVDEVMTGLYRLGSLTASQSMRIQPDIACYAKLMTAGVVPMAATLATESVFQSFQGDSKLQALLHGHSYTAFPVGCAATLAAIQLLTSPTHNPNVCSPHGPNPTCPTPDACTQACGELRAMWDGERVQRLSRHPLIDHVLATGTVFAAKLRTQQSAGYASTSSVEVVTQLRDLHGVYARPLGDIVYLMVPPTVTRSKCDQLLDTLSQVLDACNDPARSRSSEAGDGCVV